MSGFTKGLQQGVKLDVLEFVFRSIAAQGLTSATYNEWPQRDRTNGTINLNLEEHRLNQLDVDDGLP